jgi:tetratricopeptide (TPR) repeat protein
MRSFPAASQAGVWLAAWVLAAYANALGGTFQFDDFNVIVDLNTVHSLQAWFADAGQGIRPLLKLSYTLNWIAGAGAPGFVAVNVLVHLLTVWLVYRLSQAFLQAHGLSARLPHAPWAAAALFALHPANTEAVTYICGRSTSLMALLYLAGLWAHGVAASGSWRQKCLPALCFALALGVKETAVTFPLALLLWDLASGRRVVPALQKAWPCWALLLGSAGVFVYSDAYWSAMQRSVAFNTLLGNAATQLLALVYLLRQWALPLWLNIDPDVPVQPDFALVWPALGVLALLLYALWADWRPRPWIGFALAWLLLHLVPLYLLLPRLDVANDRQLYLAIWPMGLALAVELQLRLSARSANAVLAALLVAGAALTALRNRDYHSEIALWEQTVRLSPDKSRVHNNLGYAYKLADRPAEARREFLQALWLDKSNVKARLNLRRLNAQQTPLAAPNVQQH